MKCLVYLDARLNIFKPNTVKSFKRLFNYLAAAPLRNLSHPLKRKKKKKLETQQRLQNDVGSPNHFHMFAFNNEFTLGQFLRNPPSKQSFLSNRVRPQCLTQLFKCEVGIKPQQRPPSLKSKAQEPK